MAGDPSNSVAGSSLALSPRNGVHWNWVIVLLGLAALGPVLVSVIVIGSSVPWRLPHAKLFLLGVEYFLTLPLLFAAALVYRRRPYAERHAGLSTRPRLLIALFLYAAILIPLAASLGLGRYQGDESAYLFEARCLDAGHLSAAQPKALPPQAIGFAHHLILNGRWLGKYPPGWPLILSVMTMMKVEWLLNPLLGLVLLLITYRIGRYLFGRAEGLSATVLLGVSAFMILNCLGFMSHVLSAVLCACAVACFVRLLDPRSSHQFWACTLFASLAAAQMVRPFTAMCVGAALIVAWQFRPQWRALLRLAGWMALFGVIVAVIMGIENYLLTGDFFRTAYSVYGNGQLREFSLKPSDLALALGKDTPVRLVDTASVIFPFVPLLALYGFWRYRHHRGVWGIALVFVSLVISYAVERENSDSPIGERFYFEGYFALALVAGVGLVRLGRDLHFSSRMRQQFAAALITASLAAIAMCTYWEIGLREPSNRMALAMQQVPFPKGVVFVQGTEEFPAFNWNFNDPSSGVLELIDPGPGRREAVAKSAGAHRWICLYYDTGSQAPVWGSAGVVN